MNKPLKFLQQLAQHNNKVWFDAHRNEYQAARNEWLELVQTMIAELLAFDTDFAHLDPKKCIYRINRDVRFGKDKTPYKTNFGAFFVPEGKMSGKAGYYLHLQPGNCFIAGGIHCPENTQTHQIREHIAHDEGRFRSIVEAPDFKAYFTEIDGPRLKRPPRGYDPEHTDLEYLKLKGYTVSFPIHDEDFSKPDFPMQAMELFRAMKPFVDYLNQAIAQ